MPRSRKIKDYLLGQRYWEVFVIPQDETIIHACELMEKNRIGALIVVDQKTATEKDDHHVVGIVTERDIVKTISHHQLDLEGKPVKEIMSKNVVSASPENTTNEAIKLMVENQIRHLAILDEDRLIGVISMRDIFYSLNFSD
jgi:CBS domain-containing protein|tara:strand:- start:179 stop:604 length:426 start_codon:yes stop_codon:yes gene_type:complete